MSQLGIHYPLNPWLNEKTKDADSKFLSGPGPGYRAPDASLGDTTLFELFKEYPFNILIFLANEQEKNTINDNKIREIENIFPNWIRVLFIVNSSETRICSDRYGVSNQAIYFIRPDGYIGFRSCELNLDDLQKYLNKFF